PHLFALLSWTVGKQFLVFGAAADSRVIPAYIHEGIHAGRRYLRRREAKRHRCTALVVGVFSFDLQLFFAGFANPVVFALDEGVVVDTLTVVLRAEITLHGRQF